MSQKLQQVIDTSLASPQIKHVVDTIKIQSPDTMELVSKVDQFYNNAWDKLAWFLGTVILIFSIIVPIAIQYFQIRTLRKNEQALEEKLNARLSNAINLMAESTRKKLDEMEVRMNYVISSRVKSIEAELANIQKKFEEAAYLYTVAARDSLMGDGSPEKAISALDIVAAYLIAIDPKLYLEKFAKKNENFTEIMKQIRTYSKGNSEIINLLDQIDNLLYR